jgi:peroxiredoxin Q/BCP
MIAIGEPAPAFEGVDQTGNTIRLSDLLGRPVVLFFFPKAGTKICTEEACNFQQELPQFEADGVSVVGISRDSTQNLKAFSERFGLGYPLVSDSSGSIAASYGIPRVLGMVTSRATIVVDDAGIVRATFRNEFNAAAHVEAALLALETLNRQTTQP